MPTEIPSEHILRVFALQALILVEHHRVDLKQRRYNLGGAISILLPRLEGSRSTNFRALKQECSRLKTVPGVHESLLLQAAREHFAIPEATPYPSWPSVSPSFASLLRYTAPKTRVARVRTSKKSGGRSGQLALI